MALTRIDLQDDEKLVFGTGNDLELQHTSGHSRITHGGAGNLIVETTATDSDLYLRGKDKVHIQPNDGNDGVVCNAGGSTELYFSNVKKLQTDTAGTLIVGDLLLNSADDHKIKMGAGNDFEIYHQASDSSAVIKNVNDTGFLRILSGDSDSSGILLKNRDDDVTYLRAKNEAGVELFYADTLRLETTASGVNIPGGQYLQIKHDTGRLTFGADDDMQFYHDGSVGRLYNTTGSYVLRADSFYFQKGDGSEHMARFINDGACELWHNDTNTFQTAAHGATIHNVADARLVIQGSGHPSVDLSTTGTTDNCSVNFGDSDDGDAGEILYAHTGNTMRFYTGGTEQMRLSSDGLHLGGTGSDNAMDDYEEGYWTPVASGGVSGTQDLDSGANQGSYTKVGRIVHIGGRLKIGGSSITASGIMRFSLPFTNAQLNDEADLYQMAINTHGISLPGTHQTTFGEFDGNSDKFIVVFQRDNDGWSALNWSDCGVGDYITFMGSFIAA